jgi:hypothetical protein
MWETLQAAEDNSQFWKIFFEKMGYLFGITPGPTCLKKL